MQDLERQMRHMDLDDYEVEGGALVGGALVGGRRRMGRGCNYGGAYKGYRHCLYTKDQYPEGVRRCPKYLDTPRPGWKGESEARVIAGKNNPWALYVKEEVDK